MNQNMNQTSPFQNNPQPQKSGYKSYLFFIVAVVVILVFGSVYFLFSRSEEKQTEAVVPQIAQSPSGTQSVNPSVADETITASTYAPHDVSWDGVSGYLDGTYINVFRMNIRTAPTTLNTDSQGLVQIGESTDVVAIEQGSDGKVWGRRQAGNWICLYESGRIFCYGPGAYTALENLGIYEGINGLDTGEQIERGWSILITSVSKSGENIWGFLEDGRAVELYANETSRVGR